MNGVADIRVSATVDVVRVNYECRDRDCGGAYTERQYDRETSAACGLCGGPLDKLTLVIGRRESIFSNGRVESDAA